MIAPWLHLNSTFSSRDSSLNLSLCFSFFPLIASCYLNILIINLIFNIKTYKAHLSFIQFDLILTFALRNSIVSYVILNCWSRFSSVFQKTNWILFFVLLACVSRKINRSNQHQAISVHLKLMLTNEIISLHVKFANIYNLKTLLYHNIILQYLFKEKLFLIRKWKQKL